MKSLPAEEFLVKNMNEQSINFVMQADQSPQQGLINPTSLVDLSIIV